ncbi:MAG: GNAT family N-acetyltransferase [Bacteroidetes bacterium]|nr:GNAT family N-acetyltransferase [Bacteroidota bacterium]
MTDSFTVEKVSPKNFELLLGLIVALAEFEELAPPDIEARTRLRKDCFSENPRFESFLGYKDGKAVSYVIIFETYSSFLAKPTLYLEDLFVLPEYRKSGVGYRFFQFVARLAVERGCGRMEWQVLDWNENAIKFYDRLGATHLKGWYPYRLTEDELQKIL